MYGTSRHVDWDKPGMKRQILHVFYNIWKQPQQKENMKIKWYLQNEKKSAGRR